MSLVFFWCDRDKTIKGAEHKGDRGHDPYDTSVYIPDAEVSYVTKLYIGTVGGSLSVGRADHTGKSHLPRRHTYAKFSKSNIPLTCNFNGTASMVSMVSGPGK